MAKTQEELKELKEKYDSLTSKLKELNDDDLKQVVGGSFYDMEYFEKESDVKYLFKVGDVVEVRTLFYIGTVQCTITAVKSEWDESSSDGAPGVPGSAWYDAGFVDKYYCQEKESHWYFPNDWYTRDMIQKKQ